jgi:hypothetical protein
LQFFCLIIKFKQSPAKPGGKDGGMSRIKSGLFAMLAAAAVAAAVTAIGLAGCDDVESPCGKCERLYKKCVGEAKNNIELEECGQDNTACIATCDDGRPYCETCKIIRDDCLSTAKTTNDINKCELNYDSCIDKYCD